MLKSDSSEQPSPAAKQGRRLPRRSARREGGPGAESTIQQLGHGDYDMLFGHYRTLMTKDEAEKIFSLTPDVVSEAV